MKATVEAESVRADIETTPDGTVHVALSNSAGRGLTSATFTPERSDRGWIVVGAWNAKTGDPLPLAMVPDCGYPPQINGDHVWDTRVVASSPELAAIEATDKIKAMTQPGVSDVDAASWRAEAADAYNAA